MSSATVQTLENVLYEKKSGIGYVTVNRPKVLNALNHRTWEDLQTAFEDARDDVEVRRVILTGAGDRAFIAGADISELADVRAVDAERSSRRAPCPITSLLPSRNPWTHPTRRLNREVSGQRNSREAKPEPISSTSGRQEQFR